MIIVAGAEPVEVRVAGIQPVPSQPGNPLCAATLQEIGGTRRMRVVMTKPQADHLAMHPQNMPTERPMTYSLMAGLLQALGGRLVEARITRTDRNTIYANAIIEGAYGRQVLDDRPSDAINLAIRTGAPIRVMPDVLEAMQIPGNEDGATGIEWA